MTISKKALCAAPARRGRISRRAGRPAAEHDPFSNVELRLNVRNLFNKEPVSIRNAAA